MSILNGPVIEASNSQNPKKIVIFCHGYGADGNDLISLANYFQPTLPDAVSDEFWISGRATWRTFWRILDFWQPPGPSPNFW